MHVAWQADAEEPDIWRAVHSGEELLASLQPFLIYETYEDTDMADFYEDIKGQTGKHILRNANPARLNEVRLYDQPVHIAEDRAQLAEVVTTTGEGWLVGYKSGVCQDIKVRVAKKRGHGKKWQKAIYLRGFDACVAVGKCLDEVRNAGADAPLVFKYLPGLVEEALACEAAKAEKRRAAYVSAPEKLTVAGVNSVMWCLWAALYEDGTGKWAGKVTSATFWVALWAHDAYFGKRATNKIIRPLAKQWAADPEKADIAFHYFSRKMICDIRDRLQPLIKEKLIYERDYKKYIASLNK